MKRRDTFRTSFPTQALSSQGEGLASFSRLRSEFEVGDSLDGRGMLILNIRQFWPWNRSVSEFTAALVADFKPERKSLQGGPGIVPAQPKVRLIVDNVVVALVDLTDPDVVIGNVG